MDPLNRVSKHARVMHLEYVVLSAPVAVLRPLAQEETASVLRFHVVHFLDESVRHATSFEDRIGESSFSRISDSLVIDHVLYRQLLEKLSSLLLLLGRLKVGLLEPVLLALQQSLLGLLGLALSFLLALLLSLHCDCPIVCHWHTLHLLLHHVRVRVDRLWHHMASVVTLRHLLWLPV